MKGLRHRASVAVLACAMFGAVAPAAQAHNGSPVPELN
jgi:hypothetical protein